MVIDQYNNGDNMSNYKADSSSIQVTDYASLIWQLNMSIIQCNVYGNRDAIPSLVENLETLLHPYVDSKYKSDIEKIYQDKIEKGRTPQETGFKVSTMREKRLLKIHRALMDLAHRKKFLPAASGSSGYMLGDE